MFAKAPKWPSNGMRASPGPSDYNIMRLFDNTKQRRCQAIPWSRKAKLGTGCQGIVWRGTFKSLPCAVKVMKAEKPSALEIRNFLEEGRVMASVAHPCIASCYMVSRRPLSSDHFGTAGAGLEWAQHEQQWFHCRVLWSSKRIGSSPQERHSAPRCAACPPVANQPQHVPRQID